MMDEKIMVYPGDEIEIKKKDNKEIVIGPGLRKDADNCVLATKYGILKQRENNFLWIDSHMKRYVPAKNDYVLGIVVMKSSETLKVDIGASEYASLSLLAFENATKRNKPNVEMNDLLFCRVLTGSKDIEPELVCIDANGKASGLGVLKDGFMFKCNIELARRLLLGSNEFLKKFQKLVPPFEIAIGINGRIWVKSNTVKQTIFIMKAIQKYAQTQPDSDIDRFFDNLIKEHSSITE